VPNFWISVKVSSSYRRSDRWQVFFRHSVDRWNISLDPDATVVMTAHWRAVDSICVDWLLCRHFSTSLIVRVSVTYSCRHCWQHFTVCWTKTVVIQTVARPHCHPHQHRWKLQHRGVVDLTAVSRRRYVSFHRTPQLVLWTGISQQAVIDADWSLKMPF